MAANMKVSIVTPEEAVWQGEAELVIARSPEGEFGIMRGHIPFLAALVPGLVTVVAGSERAQYIVPGGFLEASGPVDDYHVIVLADGAEDAGDVDQAEALKRIQEVQREKDVDVDEHAEARMRAAIGRPGTG